MRHISKTHILVAGALIGAACFTAPGSRRREQTPVEPAIEPEAPTEPVPAVRSRRVSRKLLVATVVAGAAVTAAVGIAAWTVSGTGSGYAKATTASTLTLGDASASTTAELYPGATGSAKVTLTNPNSFPIRITTVTGNGTITSDKGAACNASTGVAFVDKSGLALDVAAGATTTITIASAVTMSNASDNACQGAIFTIPVSVSGISNAS